MTVNEIVLGILSVTDASELKIIQGAINTQLNAIQIRAKNQFSIGDPVEFTSKGLLYSGRVSKLNPKTVVVDIGAGRSWRVSPTLLTKV